MRFSRRVPVSGRQLFGLPSRLFLQGPFAELRVADDAASVFHGSFSVELTASDGTRGIVCRLLNIRTGSIPTAVHVVDCLNRRIRNPFGVFGREH
jgi:hypothetical protein